MEMANATRKIDITKNLEKARKLFVELEMEVASVRDKELEAFFEACEKNGVEFSKTPLPLEDRIDPIITGLPKKDKQKTIKK